MVIRVPQHHKFSESLKEKLKKETGCDLPEWEISVSIRDDTAWSIVLVYLLSTNYKKEGDFSRRLEALTGNTNNIKLVKKSIRNFNPFRNRFSCFFSEDLKQVVNDFKVKLKWDRLFTVSDKLSAASRSLNCSILLMYGDPEVHKYTIYKNNVKEQEGMITLKTSNPTDEDNEEKKINVYNFMIESSLGIKMKRSALLYFLREVKMSKKEINKLMSLEKELDECNNLLISLLTRNSYNIIHKLYKSPYIVSKISEAGYEMDPRHRDKEGLSALYHALQNSNIMCMLYFFAINNCLLSEGSYRNPDSRIVSNLLNMQEMLSADMDSLTVRKIHHKNYNNWKKTFDELLKFNKFLMEINSKIVKIKNELNYYETQDDDVFEVCKRRDIIVSLLDTYNDFSIAVQQENLTPLSLKEYALNMNYFNLIDMATGIVFFDNIIFLKERLVLENEKQFSVMESSFCLSMIYTVIFKYVEDFTKTDPVSEFPNFYYIFPLFQRLDNSEKLREFSNILRGTVINKSNIVKGIPESEFYSVLHPHHELKDYIQKRRLEYHIKTASNMKITNVQSVLVIEHVLQVIGEYLTQEKDENCFLKRLLPLCLPKSAPRILLQIRNELTHLKSHTFPSKFECEKNLSLFRSIQKEILEINKRLEIIYHVLNLNFFAYLWKQAEMQLEKAKTSLCQIRSLITSLQFRMIELEIKDIYTNVFKKYKYAYVCLFEIILRRLEEEFGNEMSSQVLCVLRPLKWLLELAQQYNVGNDDITADAFKELENCNNQNINTSKFKEQMKIVLGHCKSFLSNHQKCVSKKRSKPLKSLKNIEYFLKILKGFVFLSDEEKDKIRKEISPQIREDVSMKEKLIRSMECGFSYDIDENPDFKISYFSKNKMGKFKKLYRSKDPEALTMLRNPDPIEELEEIFSNSYAEKKKYDALCEILQFSVETRKKLLNLVAGQKKKIPGNNLLCLLNRIQLLKKFIVEENEDVLNLWLKVKSKKSKQLISSKIIHRYLKDQQHQVSVDMLLFDCMILFEKVKSIESPWVKSSKLYSGFNLRNVISHGHPLLEFLSELIDPEDLASEKIGKILSLIECEDAVKAILELYELLKCDFILLLEVINSDESDNYSDLRKRILICNQWKDYALLLPYDYKTHPGACTPRET